MILKFLLLLFASFSVMAVENDLLFKVTLDEAFQPHAVFSKGNPKCSLTADLGLRGVKGIVSNALLLEDGERAAYKAEKNIDPRQGTISFWVCPANWDEKDKRMKYFFQASFRKPKPLALTIGKESKANSIRAYITLGSRKAGDYKIFIINGTTEWKKDLWHKVDFTWNSNEMILYVDGKKVAETTLPELDLNVKSKGGTILLVPITKTKLPNWSSEDLTKIDQVEIFNTVHNKKQVLKSYYKIRPKKTVKVRKQNFTIVPKKSGEILLDGKLDDLQWKKSSLFPIAISAVSNTISPYVSQAYICYDDKNIYLGLKTKRLKAKELVNYKKRDEMIFKDDCFEIVMFPENRTPDFYYKWVVNSAGVLLDDRKTNKKWDSKCQLKTYIGKKYWSAEIKIPVSDFKLTSIKKADTWRFNVHRSYYFDDKPNAYTSWTWQKGGYIHDLKNMGRITFGGVNDYVKFDFSKRILNGDFSAEVCAGMPAKLDAEINSSLKISKLLTKGKSYRINKTIEDATDSFLTVKVADSYLYNAAFSVKKPFELSFFPDVYKKKLGFKLKINDLDKFWEKTFKGKVNLKLSIKTPDNKTIKHNVSIDGIKKTYWIDLNFKNGQYKMSFDFTAPNGKKLNAQDTFTKPATPFVFNKSGITDKVLTPWTPMSYSGKNTVKCWNRTYKFAGPLLASVVSKGKKIMPGKMELKIKTAKASGELKVISSKILKSTLARYEAEGEAVFTGLKGKVNWKTYMEYDGFVYSTITLNPPKGGWKIKELYLKIPLRKDIVKYVRCARKSPMPLSYLKIQNKNWESGFEPYLYITNEYEGFSYMCESEANWVYNKGDKIVIVNSKNDPSITLKLISKDVKANKPLSYSFGFQTTPLKPFASGWRKQNWGSHREKKLKTENVYDSQFSYRFGIWDPSSPELMKKNIAACLKKGYRIYHYNALNNTPNKNPIFDFFKNIWLNPYSGTVGPFNNKKRSNRYVAKKLRDGITYYKLPVCPGSDSYIDYKVFLAEEIMKKAGPSCLYTDCFGERPCENSSHGCGFKDSFGKTGVRWNLLGMRDYAKRVIAVVRKYNTKERPLQWMGHRHSMFLTMVHGWTDAFYPGEQYASSMFQNSDYYMDTLDDEAWRTELSSRQTGVPHIILPEFVRGTGVKNERDKAQPTESLLAMIAVNDLKTNSAYCNVDAIDSFWSIKSRIGLNSDNREFKAYWEKDCPVKSLTSNCMASIYKIKDNHFVVVVANKTKKDQNVNIAINGNLWGLDKKKLQAVNERNSKKIKISNSKLTVKVKARNYTYITLKQ
jgi:concanavalin A-like lectin/glucanase superfamily protein